MSDAPIRDDDIEVPPFFFPGGLASHENSEERSVLTPSNNSPPKGTAPKHGETLTDIKLSPSINSGDHSSLADTEASNPKPVDPPPRYSLVFPNHPRAEATTMGFVPKDTATIVEEEDTLDAGSVAAGTFSEGGFEIVREHKENALALVESEVRKLRVTDAQK